MSLRFPYDVFIPLPPQRFRAATSTFLTQNPSDILLDSEIEQIYILQEMFLNVRNVWSSLSPTHFFCSPMYSFFKYGQIQTRGGTILRNVLSCMPVTCKK